jgi:nucleotide-binding universal stress UspA family protein
MFKTIVVPIDGSALSRQALPVAAVLAATGHAGLRLVAVARDDSELEPGRRHLDEAANTLPDTIATDLDVILEADPVGALLNIAGDVATVLCFGSHDHSHPVAELLGSVGSKVAERAIHPFVIVGPNGAQEASGDDVVVALDGRDDPDPLLATAVAWALHLAAPMRIVTVYEPVPADVRRPDHYSRGHGPSTDPDVYLDAMRGHVKDARLAGVTTAAIADPVSVADGLAHHLAEHPALLLLVGGARHHLSPSSLTRDLLRHTPPPVLVVPHQPAS